MGKPVSTVPCLRRTRRDSMSRVSQRRLFLEALEDRRLLTASPADVSPDNGFTAAEPADWLSELTGSIVDGGTVYPLKVTPRNEYLGTSIDPGRTTWLVIHGRSGAAAQQIYQDIAAAVDGYSSDDQVLLLDWETAATGFWDGESRIEPVGRWAAAALDDYGFGAGTLNLLGYSWGTYVADELAEVLLSRQSQGVNSILLLDPATDIPFNAYNPNNTATVNFAAHSEFSWAFHSGGFEGSATSPKTAHEAFVLQDSDHYEIRNQFVRLLDTNHGSLLQNPWFSLERLVNHGMPPAPWLPNAIDASGNLIPSASGGYEAVIDMDADGLAQWLTYEPIAGPPDQLQTEPFWTSQWQNQSLPTDVDASGLTTPLDVLLIINAINRFGAQTIPELAARDDVPVHYYDVNGDDEVTGADVLAVIVELNWLSDGGGEGEADEVSCHSAPVDRPLTCNTMKKSPDRANG